jgi:hypothetical protein
VAGRHADSDHAGRLVRSDVGTTRLKQSCGRAIQRARCMALKTIGTLSGAAHVSPPVVAAWYRRAAHRRAWLPHHRTGHDRRALIGDALAKPLYAAGSMPAVR